jgi:hypothetical protein
MSEGTFSTQTPLRASVDIPPCRVVSRTGAYTGGLPATLAVEPLGISASFTRDAPLPSASTLHAKSATSDPITFHGRGQKALAEVGTAIVAAGRVAAAADGSGKIIPFVAPGWSVGAVSEVAPVNSFVEVYVDPLYIQA